MQNWGGKQSAIWAIGKSRMCKFHKRRKGLRWMGSNDNQRGLFDYQMSKQPLKNVVSMLIKDKDIKSYQLLLIKHDRVLVN